MTTTALEREVEKRLRESRVRFTKARRVVIAALASSSGPRSAAQLHEHIGSDVPLSSLYRSLAVLETEQVVVPHFSAKGVTRYELADWLQGHHHHLVCVECGAVEDVTVPGDHERKLHDLVEEIGSVVSFTPLDHALEIEGRCARCA